MGNFIVKVIRGIAIGVFVGGILAVVGLGEGGIYIGFILGLIISFNIKKKKVYKTTSYRSFTKPPATSHISGTRCDNCGSTDTRVTSSDYLLCHSCGYKKA